jgi:hypothetical protein
MFPARLALSAAAVAVGLGMLVGCTAAPSPPVAHPSGATTVGCALARPVGGGVHPADLLIGPLDYPGLGNGYPIDGYPPPDRHGIRFYKVGAQLPAGQTVTVTIGASARAYAGILTERGRSAGYTAVTYRSCAPSRQVGMVFWVGGFVLAGRRSACIPLRVRTAGESTVRTASIAIPVGACD